MSAAKNPLVGLGIAVLAIGLLIASGVVTFNLLPAEPKPAANDQPPTQPVAADQQPTPAEGPTANQPTKPDAPKGTEARLRQEIKFALGDDRSHDVMLSKQDVSIVFTSATELSSKWAKPAMEADVTALLRAALRSGFRFNTLTVVGQFPTSEAANDNATDQAFRASYTRDAVLAYRWETNPAVGVADIAEEISLPSGWE